jgi:hypothetical protein
MSIEVKKVGKIAARRVKILLWAADTNPDPS